MEVDIRVLGGAALMGMLGVQAALAEGLHLVPVHQALDLGIAVLGLDGVDLLDLVGGAEAVEEVQEGHGGLDGAQVGDQGQIPVELFQILKDDAMKVLHSICQQIWKTQQWPQDWKKSVFIPIPKKGNAQTTGQLHSSHMLAK